MEAAGYSAGNLPSSEGAGEGREAAAEGEQQPRREKKSHAKAKKNTSLNERTQSDSGTPVAERGSEERSSPSRPGGAAPPNQQQQHQQQQKSQRKQKSRPQQERQVEADEREEQKKNRDDHKKAEKESLDRSEKRVTPSGQRAAAEDGTPSSAVEIFSATTSFSLKTVPGDALPSEAMSSNITVISSAVTPSGVGSTSTCTLSQRPAAATTEPSSPASSSSAADGRSPDAVSAPQAAGDMAIPSVPVLSCSSSHSSTGAAAAVTTVPTYGAAASAGAATKTFAAAVVAGTSTPVASAIASTTAAAAEEGGGAGAAAGALASRAAAAAASAAAAAGWPRPAAETTGSTPSRGGVRPGDVPHAGEEIPSDYGSEQSLQESRKSKILWTDGRGTITKLEELQKLYEEAVERKKQKQHRAKTKEAAERHAKEKAKKTSREEGAAQCSDQIHAAHFQKDATVETRRKVGEEAQQQTGHTPTSCNQSRTASPASSVDFRGRPLYDHLHCAYRATLLSHRTKNLNLRGFLNLFFMLLCVLNFRMVTDNLMEYGLMIRLPSSFDDILSNWPVLLCFALMHFCILGAYVIERLVASWVPYTLDWSETLLITINFFLVFFMPFLTVTLSSPHPASAALLLAFSVVWLFKLFSFHAVCYDARRAVRDGDDLLALCDNCPEEAEAVRRFPQSVTLRHLYTFICMPTMCFQFYYPRVPSIRWFSVARHAFESAVCLAIMKIVIDQHIYPVVDNSFTITELHTIPLTTLLFHFLDRMVRLSIPNLYVWLLMFVGLFHHWCNILAEITRFGDRQFYLDWWNASSVGEYWRKWNLPIHYFLNRHVNKPLRRANFPRSVATSTVFLISALLHEYMVSVPLHLGWTGWVFFAFMAQAPLIRFTNAQFFQSHPTVGNCFFWFVLCFSGQPLGILIYWYLWGVKHGTVQELDPRKIQIM